NTADIRHSDFVIRPDKPSILNGTNCGGRMVVDQRKNTVWSLDQCCTALDPIAAVVVRHVAELADGGVMNVAAQDSIHAVAFGVMRHSSFEFADKAHRVFHTPFGIRAE